MTKGNIPKQMSTKTFSRLALITIVAVYLLILVGGTVRATGSGMGCPDWPTCFGRLVPPTSEAELPADWRVTYGHRGYADLPFDPVKTWTEYLNRLLGVTIGLLVSATALASWRLRKLDPRITTCAIGAFLAVGFNGWVGSQVVASNLRPLMISLHMLGAFVVQMLLIWAWVRCRSLSATDPLTGAPDATMPSWIRRASLWILGVLTLQIFMGIQIRESVDLVSRLSEDLQRSEWLSQVPPIFYIHRSFSWVVLGLVIWFFVRALRSADSPERLRTAVKVTIGLVVFEMMLGGALNHLGFPLIAQPLHLLTAHLIFGALWFSWCLAACFGSNQGK